MKKYERPSHFGWRKEKDRKKNKRIKNLTLKKVCNSSDDACDNAFVHKDDDIANRQRVRVELDEVSIDYFSQEKNLNLPSEVRSDAHFRLVDKVVDGKKAIGGGKKATSRGKKPIGRVIRLVVEVRSLLVRVIGLNIIFLMSMVVFLWHLIFLKMILNIGMLVNSCAVMIQMKKYSRKIMKDSISFLGK